MTLSIRSSFVLSSTSLAGCPIGDRPEFVCIGRSNVGKSSLINALCRVKQLAKTSAQPGKTQLINYFSIETKDDLGSCQRYLVDLPGYGYAKSSQEARHQWSLMIEEYLLGRTSISQIYVLIDSRLSPQGMDLDFMQWLEEYERPYTLVFTKADKLSSSQVRHTISSYIQTVQQLLGHTPSHYITSALDPKSIQSLLVSLHEQASHH